MAAGGLKTQAQHAQQQGHDLVEGRRGQVVAPVRKKHGNNNEAPCHLPAKKQGEHPAQEGSPQPQGAGGCAVYFSLVDAALGFILFYMDENSPLSGEFQKGEAYPHQKAALLCYKKDVLTFSVAKESNNG